ncbi:MAG: YhcH/YjgK/YiaL family protein [Clostridia bacterium]|nr:YhcH/YjgK/YiaL family protein [Clostridia bacterium]
MILDRISRLPLYESVIPGAGRIAAAFAASRPEDTGLEVRQKAYALKELGQRRFEVHSRTMDLMLARAGAEEIALCPAEWLEKAEPLPNGTDGWKQNGAPCGSFVRLETGYFCAIFPGEAHMVGGKVPDADKVEKWVVKAPCPFAFRVEDGL